MMKKLLKITEIVMLPKSAKFSNYEIYRFQIMVAQIKDLNEYLSKIDVPISYTFREISRQRA